MTAGRFALQTIADQLGGRLDWPTGSDVRFEFTHLATDSRKLHRPGEGLSQTLFIALKGPRHNGHDHLSDVRARGVKGFIVDLSWSGSMPGAVVLRVPHALDALQCLGAMSRFSRQGTVVGITGSNGKTTVKEWAHTLAGQDHRVSRSPGSWNSQVGVPLSLWAMDDKAAFHFVEAGISKPGEMAALARIIRPEIGVLVHFGDAHDAHFDSRLDKAREKLRLFEGADRIVMGSQDSVLMEAVAERGWESRCVHWQWKRPDGDATFPSALIVERQDLDHNVTRVVGTWRNAPLDWTIPFSEPAALSNAMTAALLLLELGWTPSAIQPRLKELRPLGMRMEHLEGRAGGTIINDTWNNDLDGLSTALDALERLPNEQPRAVILSDLIPFDRQDEGQNERLKRAIGQRRVDRWISVGPQLSQGIPGVEHIHAQHPNTESLLESADLSELEGWNVLVKGARPFAFEQVAEALEANPHTTVFDLDLGRLGHNLDRFKDRFSKPVMGMVKAFAYGAGDAVALELDRLGIDRLAVAFAEEGVALRKRGVRCPILVLNADARRFADLIQWRLEPEVHRLPDLDRWADALRRSGPVGQEKEALGVHLKVETGMHRLGLQPEQWEAAGATCSVLRLPIVSVYSHLSAADDPQSDPHTHHQISQFKTACAAVAKGWSSAQKQAEQPSNPTFLKHLVNTAGAIRFPEAHFDLIRIGLGLYGLDASGSVHDLKPIGAFHTAVSHVHLAPAGEAVGYGAKDVSDEDRMVATLPVGYADGLPRAAGLGKASLYVCGELRPILGPVCMDSCMLDVTGLDVQRGSAVEVFGDNASLEALAKATNTIPYELLCRIPQRVRRRHLRT